MNALSARRINQVTTRVPANNRDASTPATTPWPCLTRWTVMLNTPSVKTAFAETDKKAMMQTVATRTTPKVTTFTSIMTSMRLPIALSSRPNFPPCTNTARAVSPKKRQHGKMFSRGCCHNQAVSRHLARAPPPNALKFTMN